MLLSHISVDKCVVCVVICYTNTFISASQKSVIKLSQSMRIQSEVSKVK